jgi:Domain of unknown function (DUF4136)
MKTVSFIVACLATALLLGCSSVSVTTDYDHDVSFAGLKTFAWMAASKDALNPNAQASMFKNSLVEKRFRTAVVTQLGAKGLKEDAANPDFLVMYYAGTQEKVNVTNYGYGYGRWGGYGGGGVDVQQYTQGTIILDFVDAKTKQLIWRSAATGALSSNPDPASSGEKLDEVVAQMLAEYPPGSGK